MSRRPLPNRIESVEGHPELLSLVVPTTQRGYAPEMTYIFDRADLRHAQLAHWHVGARGGRAICHWGKKRETFYLARLIADVEPGQRIKSVNGVAGDLRRANLKVCKPAKRTLERRASILARKAKTP